MAKKEDAKPKVSLERTYNVPLRKEFQKAPSYKRAKKAVKALTEFLQRHMKSDKVRLSRQLNMKVWERGIKRPPHHVSVRAVKYDDGSVQASLVGEKPEAKKSGKQEKKEKQAAKAQKGKQPEEAAKVKEAEQESEVKANAESKIRGAVSQEKAGPVKKAPDAPKPRTSK